MMTTRLLAAAPFAHLLGLGKPAAKKRAEDDEDMRRAEDDAEGDPDETGEGGEGGDDAEGDPEEHGTEDSARRAKKAKKKRAKRQAEDTGDVPEDQQDDPDAPDPDDDDDDDPEADDEGDDDGGDDDGDAAEMRGRSIVARARRRERARCAAIFACPAAAKNVALAAHLAFNTRLTRNEAISALGKAAPGVTGLAARMEGYAPRLGPGGALQGDGKREIARSWDAAFKAARG
jgi:hypothetical protein